MVEQVDLAASLIKVADINGALGDAAAAQAHVADARDITASLQEAELDASVERKLAGVKAYLETAAKA
jgi:hypothetical protein